MQENENRTYEYASVYLLDNPYCIDTTYDYFIPLDIRASVHRGAFVTVPFGKGNRKHMALVVELCRCPSVYDVKPISSVCSDKMSLDEEMLGLCAYIKDQVLCTMGDTVRCVVPSAVLGRLSEYYYPTPGGAPDPSAGFSPADLFVYDHIVGKGFAGIDTLKSKFGAATAEEAVKKLLSKGFLRREMQVNAGSGEAFENYYRPSITPDECKDILDGRGRIRLTSQKHKEILLYACECGEELCAGDIISATGASPAQVKALVDKGLLIKEPKRVYREPFSYTGESAKEIILSEEQSRALSEIKAALSSEKAEAILLHGVTGSGKTSVMIKAIEEAISSGRGVIVLLPEIALTPQTVGIFCSHFGKRVALVHSGLSAGERFDAFMKISSGEADIVIGTRSAIFSPVKALGLIIIDEEHEATYKSEISPKYHARDIARWRCAYNKGVMLLASATPSMESYSKAREGKYKLVTLKDRFGGARLPEVKIHDMRNEPTVGNTSPLGSLLVSELKKTVGRGEQAILFLNRRGYNTMMSCRTCGQTVTCPHCSISMNYHTEKGRYDRGFLFCHWCGTKIPVPVKCPSCSSEHLLKMGFGTQKIQQELEELLPGKKILRMDADSTSRRSAHEQLLTSFRNHEADVLLGTQMVTKGHDFPDVTLVGVLLADMSLYLDDYHANERTFSMITQVIGRAGRSEKPGLAIIQTNNPDNDIIKLACSQDYEKFYENEIRLRKLLVFPPYCDIALLTLTSSDEKQTIMSATRLKGEIEVMLKTNYSDVQMIVFGPFEAPVYKVEEKYRMRMVIKCRLNKRSREMFSEILTKFGRLAERTALTVDFNPTGL